jgi:histidinol dehydrogenase
MDDLIKRLDTAEGGFDGALAALWAWDGEADAEVREAVRAIIEAVRNSGDEALVRFTNQFDRRAVGRPGELELSELHSFTQALDAELVQALDDAAQRIRIYHERQRQDSCEDDGTVLGQQVTPLDRVGVYVPGGKAAYPSSVLMNVIPAKVAGVEEVVMVVPAPSGEVEPVVPAAAAIAGVDRLFTIGGAQAIAALAYGTETVPAVDKIVGPGNIYVATAKAQVFGKVGIDMIAGPSEILIICDGRTDPDWVVMDLFAQAEHDELAQAILLSPDRGFLDAVEKRIGDLLPAMERRETIRASLSGRGALIEVRDLEQAMELANRVAPEHLELSVEDPHRWLPRIRHAGAVFLGRFTAEAVGDYCAGPNHVLPTSGTARFSSPLGVYDFQKRTSIIECSPSGSARLSRVAGILARSEGLTAHARSAAYRDPEMG